MERWFPQVAVPVLTFVLGIIVQPLFEQWLVTQDMTLVATAIVAVGIIAICVMLSELARSNQNRFNSLSTQVSEIFSRTGLKVEYVEDDITNPSSYRKAIELIRSADRSITFVDYWVPFENYQTKDMVKDIRDDFYDTIIKQVKAHTHSHEIFHRRIVQVPAPLFGSTVPFEQDQRYFEYLRTVTQLQAQYPRACSVKLAVARFNLHFIIIDRRYVILPILTADTENKRQTRHGALIFDDVEGSLVDSLIAIYQIINAQARPLELSDLKLPMTTTAPLDFDGHDKTQRE